MREFRPPMVRMQYVDLQLRANRYPNCSGIARYFDISPKSIQRDIKYMKNVLGAPIAYDSRRRGYCYLQEWELSPAERDCLESRALMAVNKVLSQYQGTPLYDEVGRALHKVLQYLPVADPEGFLFDSDLSTVFEHASRTRMEHVVITFSSHQAQWIRTRKLHPAQSLQEHKDGSVTLSMDVVSLDGVKRWVMRYGAEARVISPEALRDMIKDEVVRLGMLYLDILDSMPEKGE
ncbi:MAG: WYL domain-containing protein [Chlorobium sp.]|nr:WYL domain-containing protein [Chlorobium sp.]